VRAHDRQDERQVVANELVPGRGISVAGPERGDVLLVACQRREPSDRVEITAELLELLAASLRGALLPLKSGWCCNPG
jgi:hypothetical protein